MIDYRIRPMEGFDDKLGELVSMLEHARGITLKDISSLSQDDLDYLPDESSNSIGALLMHIASVEFAYQIISFEHRDINKNERLKWEAALELEDKAKDEIKGKPLDYYLNVLSETREKTLSLLKSQKDNWLYEEQNWGTPINNYWMWFHVMEDEISHRGQVRTIKRLLNNKVSVSK